VIPRSSRWIRRSALVSRFIKQPSFLLKGLFG
jgi:hypothetical protein